MNKGSIIVTIGSISDIEKIDKDVKYININIDNVNIDVIDYFLINGKDYLYSDSINGLNGFIYTDYNTFYNGEKIIGDIIDSMPSNLSTLEQVRYLYISLGRILSSDINIREDKNEIVSFGSISTINNIWGSLSKKSTNDISISKLLMYVCSRIGIKSEIVSGSINGNIGNRIYIDDGNFIVVNLFNDLALIQGRFMTKYFDKYNNDKKLDIKVKYIKSEYTNYYLSNKLANISYLDSDVIKKILGVVQEIVDVRRIGTLELGSILKMIFSEYLPNYDVKINNFYVNRDGVREHFIVVNYGEEYYSFNYNRNTFMMVSYDEIYNNMENKLIGLYNDEDFKIREESLVRG